MVYVMNCLCMETYSFFLTYWCFHFCLIVLKICWKLAFISPPWSVCMEMCTQAMLIKVFQHSSSLVAVQSPSCVGAKLSWHLHYLALAWSKPWHPLVFLKKSANYLHTGGENWLLAAALTEAGGSYLSVFPICSSCSMQ